MVSCYHGIMVSCYHATCTRSSPLLVNMYPVLLVPLSTPQYGCFVPNVDRLHTVLTLLLRLFVSSPLPICVLLLPSITTYHPLFWKPFWKPFWKHGRGAHSSTPNIPGIAAAALLNGPACGPAYVRRATHVLIGCLDVLIGSSGTFRERLIDSCS